MLAFLVFQALSMVGGYKTVSPSSPEVEFVRPWLEKKVEKLFNDAIHCNVVKAEKQIVAGYNLRLTIESYPGLRFVIVLWVNIKQEIKVTSIEGAANKPVTLGGWSFVAPEAITETEISDACAIIKRVDGVTFTPKRVVCARAQSGDGTNRHYIIEDEDGNLHSTVVHRPRNGGKVQLLYYSAV